MSKNSLPPRHGGYKANTTKMVSSGPRSTPNGTKRLPLPPKGEGGGSHASATRKSA